MKQILATKIILILLLLGAIIGILATVRDVEIVPAWSVFVVDAQGNPISGISVDETWDFFGIRSRGSDEKVTDASGRAAFPRRSFRIPRTVYLLNWAVSHLNVHASFGPSASLRIYPQGQKTTGTSYGTDRRLYDDPGAQSQQTAAGLETTLRVLPCDILDFIYRNDWNAAKEAIRRDPLAASLRGPCGVTPLIALSERKFIGEDAKMMELLLLEGADVNAATDDGITALHRAAEHQDVTEMEFLLSRKANPNAKVHDSVYYTTNGYTPLHFQLSAAEYGFGASSTAERIKGIRLLLDHGADLNARDAQGNTPLHLAALYGIPEIVSALLTLGADPRAVNAEKETPRSYIDSLNGTPEIKQIRTLLSAAEAKNPK